MSFLKNSMKKKNKKLIHSTSSVLLVTHNGSFHADDIFACATLSLMLEKKNENFEIIRTRDKEIINSGDYIFDVGEIYAPEKNRFDHHQKGGAGKRDNGIEYSSFGLVWKKFGEELCGSLEIANRVDKRIVQQIDANDNGIDLYKNNFENIFPYTVNDVLSIFSLTSLEDMNKDTQFFKALVWAKEILNREIKKANDKTKITEIIQNFYKNSDDKRLVIIDTPEVSRYEIWDALQDFPEPLFVVYKTDEWRIVAMRSDYNSFRNRKDLPSSWAGLREEELQRVTEVSDAIFCHRGLFLAGAKTKEGAIKLAELALLN